MRVAGSRGRRMGRRWRRLARVSSLRRRPRDLVRSARSQLRWFRQGSILAVALTGLLLLLVPDSPEVSADPGPAAQQEESTGRETAGADQGEPGGPGAARTAGAPAQVAAPAGASPLEEAPLGADDVGRAARDEAAGTVRRLWRGFLGVLPKMLVALAALLVAWAAARALRSVIGFVLGQWERAQAVGALVGIGVWIFAIGVALSVLAGDIRALVGSIGLLGLALSWALQAPIESFTGWLLNSFRGYYRRGDRILVGEVFGDVYRIDLLTTTVWEIGAPFRPGYVHAEQPTGRLQTFPNSEILTGTVTNLTREFPYVWDELALAVGNESNLRTALDVVGRSARDVLGERMRGPAESYRQLLEQAGLEAPVAEEPQIFILPAEFWTDIVVRYLVGARERRVWKSELYLRVSEALRDPALASAIFPAYPRRQVQFLGPDGAPSELPPRA